MGESGGDEEEDGESEDDNEDGHGTGGADKRSGTQRRKLRSFHFRTGAVVRTTTDNGRDVTVQCQVGGHVDYKKILIMSNGGTQVVQSHFLKCHTELNVMIRGLQNTVGADDLKFFYVHRTQGEVKDSDGQVKHRSDLDELLGMSTVSSVSKGKLSFKRTCKSNR